MGSAQEANNGILLSGSVIYEQIVKLNIQLEGEAAQFADALPKEQTSEKILHFSESAALFENYQVQEPEDDMPMEGSMVMIKMVEPDNKTYIDLESKKSIEQQEFMSRIFLIESDLAEEKWKMTGNQKTILEYACQEAVREEEGKKTHVWFTPQIAVPVGPGRYSGLPGLVLAVSMNDGDQVLKATSVELKPVEKEVLRRPTKGKKVTEDEFETLVAEKMKEMGVEGTEGGTGSSHTMVIKINN